MRLSLPKKHDLVCAQSRYVAIYARHSHLMEPSVRKLELRAQKAAFLRQPQPGKPT